MRVNVSDIRHLSLLDRNIMSLLVEKKNMIATVLCKNQLCAELTSSTYINPLTLGVS